jgi:hypothetical protein
LSKSDELTRQRFFAVQVYPATMQYLDKGSANLLSILWFAMLFLLGIDSMFAMVEGMRLL